MITMLVHYRTPLDATAILRWMWALEGGTLGSREGYYKQKLFFLVSLGFFW